MYAKIFKSRIIAINEIFVIKHNQSLLNRYDLNRV